MFHRARAERAANRPSVDTILLPRRPARFDPRGRDAKSALRWECSDRRSDALCTDQQRSHRKDSSITTNQEYFVQKTSWHGRTNIQASCGRPCRHNCVCHQMICVEPWQRQNRPLHRASMNRTSPS